MHTGADFEAGRVHERNQRAAPLGDVATPEQTGGGGSGRGDIRGTCVGDDT